MPPHDFDRPDANRSVSGHPRAIIAALAAIAAATVLLACSSPGPPSPPSPSHARLPVRADSPCQPAPLAGPLFLRGSMTNWALDDDYAFQYVCNEYLLNVDLHGVHNFRLSALGAQPQVTFGAGSVQDVAKAAESIQLAGSADGASGDVRFEFDGAQTIHVAASSRGADALPTLSLRITPKDFDDPADRPVSNAVALGVSFDSRDVGDKSPFGAVIAGTSIHYRLHAPAGVTRATLVVERRVLEGPQDVLEYHEVARVPLRRGGDGGDDGEDWRGDFLFDAIGIYGYYFEIGIDGEKFLYQNNRDSIYWTREKGSGGLGRIEAASDPLHRIRRFRQTVYRADYAVPAWARDAVFYYIFPERFRNGDMGNDPKPGPNTFHDRSVEVHANWLDTPWRPGSGDGSDDLYGNDFFGGDLAGITRKLDYIGDLGANTLYLTPIFQAASNHKYDTADYRHVDPHFGSDADFEELAREAKARGMRIVLDASLNHTGSDSVYFDRWGKFPGVGAFDGGRIRAESAYADWYAFDRTQSDPQRQWHGWNGSRDLPELNKASPSFREFAFGAPDSIMNLWLDRGAAGWRMDVAPWVPDDFWREWRRAVKAHRPDALAICETQFEAAKFFLGDEFDATMNYVFRNAVEAYANGGDARAAYANLELLREMYPPQALFAQMNLLSTHDSARALHDFGWHAANDDPATITLAKRRLRLAAFFQMTFPGAPAVLYGDEVGVTGGDDPFNRVTYPWADRGGKPDLELRDDYRRLIRLRREHPVLRHGSLDAPLRVDEHVIVLLRRDGAVRALVAMNNDAVAHTVTVPRPDDGGGATWRDAATAQRLASGDQRITLTIPALSGRVLEGR
jgi:glycosidase